ncbi:DUF378 domain-containing protein [Oceanobacillus damuensis]|uniref:DUF378 domain-containing protein n=1 Tax=Oceanobacillus damuensis TaxID=937928 RepID=UPI00082AED16|nr:DUF378 domain-containing protein [Oceanobacillus damuensis]
MRTLKTIALTLIIIGALNWGLIAFFQFDLVAAIFGGQDAFLSRLVYGLVGLSALYYIVSLFNPMDVTNNEETGERRETGNLNYGTEFGEETETEAELYNRSEFPLHPSETERKSPRDTE